MTLGSSRRLLRAALLGLAWGEGINLVEGLVQIAFDHGRDAGEWMHSIVLYAWVGLVLGLAVGLVVSGLELIFPFSIRRRLDLHRLDSPLLFAAFTLAVGGYWLNVWPKMPSFTSAAGKLATLALAVVVTLAAASLFAIARRRAGRRRPDAPAPSRPARVALGVLVLLLAAAPSLLPGRPTPRGPAVLSGEVPAESPPLIVILVDTLRRDHLGFYGYERDTSPNLDALAAQSIVFDASNTTGNFTIPSTATFFTGLYPSAHGVLHPHDRFPSDVATLTERLQAAGYRTGAFVGNPTMRAEMGYARGFETFHPAPPPRWVLHRKTALELIATRLSAGGDVSPTRNLVPRALEWIRQDDSRPPFLYLHLIDPHSGYVPPREHFEPFLPEGIEDGPAHPPRLFHYYHDDWIPWEEVENAPRLTRDEVAGMVARYDGEIHFVDMWIGRFLDALRDDGILDEAMVVFLSDHGEEFGEHGGWFHGETLYAEMVDMPLLIKLPHGRFAGFRTELSLDMVDLASTLESWIGLSAAEGRQGQDLATPLRSLADKERSLLEVQPQRFTFFERPPRLAGLEWEDLKLIRRTVKGQDTVQLFDLRHDPAETHDLAAERADARVQLEDMLTAFLGEIAREGVLDEAEDVDPETLRILRTLGYVE